MDNILNDEYYGFTKKSQENLSFIPENPLNHQKSIFSWPTSFPKSSKRWWFLVEMASFRLNHKIFSGFVARSELKKKKFIQKFLEKIRFNENHMADSDFEKSPFSTHSNVYCEEKAVSTNMKSVIDFFKIVLDPCRSLFFH
jgi:hypothetical protein